MLRATVGDMLHSTRIGKRYCVPSPYPAHGISKDPQLCSFGPCTTSSSPHQLIPSLQVWMSFLHESGLEPHLLQNLAITSAVPGRVQFTLPIEAHHTNRLSILHGGTISSMVDLGGSLAVASRGLYATGLSTDLNVTFLSSGGKTGEIITGDVTCDKFGKTLAFTSIVFRNAAGETFARGSHTKYVQRSWANERNMVDEIKKEAAEGAGAGVSA